MSGDGRWIVSGGEEGKVRVWDGRRPKAEPQVLAGQERERDNRGGREWRQPMGCCWGS